jgi:hypothetical protein
VGPSSSHTAGACRLALIARHLLGEVPKRVEFGLHGSFAKTGKRLTTVAIFLVIHFTSRVDSDSTAGVSLERLWLRPFTHEARTKPGSLGLGSLAAKAWPT